MTGVCGPRCSPAYLTLPKQAGSHCHYLVVGHALERSSNAASYDRLAPSVHRQPLRFSVAPFQKKSNTEAWAVRLRHCFQLPSARAPLRPSLLIIIRTSMEDRLVQLLANTQLPDQAPRQQAELELKAARKDAAFPVSLANVAAHTSVDTSIRQAALSTLRLFIESNWANEDPDEVPPIPISEEARAALKQTLLELALSTEDERKVKISARCAVDALGLALPLLSSADPFSSTAMLSERSLSMTSQSSGPSCSLPFWPSPPRAPMPSSTAP